MIERIASVTPAPVRTLVNTHSHPDHTNGNYLFADATRSGRRAAGQRCRRQVRDNGVGVPPEMLPHVFDIFTQVNRLLGHRRAGWASA